MNAPRPNTRLDRLWQEIKRLAELGQPMPRVTEIGIACGFPYQDLYRLLDEGRERCLWTLERDGARIVAICGTDGDWKLHCSMRRNVVPAVSVRRYRDKPGPKQTLPRKCLRCRMVFAPMHKGNFLCEGCRAFAAQAAP
jgi:hypothetical protein